MQVGMATIFQNPGRACTDREVDRRSSASRNSPCRSAFESIWGVEHHFTDYTMCPDVLQFLTYMAGRTPRASSSARWSWCCRGTIRCASPSKCPCSTTCPTAASSSASAAAREGRVRRLPAVRWTSRARASSRSAEMILEGIERGYCEYDGKYVRQPRATSGRAVQVLPGRTSRGGLARVGADHGRARGRHPDHPAEAVEDVAKELDGYRAIYREVNRARRPPPIAAGWTSATRAPSGRARWRAATSAATSTPSSATTSSTGDHLGQRRRATSTTARWRRRSRRTAPKGDRVLRGPPGVGHARAVLREDHGHPPQRRGTTPTSACSAMQGCPPTTPSATYACSPPRCCPPCPRSATTRRR